MCIIDNIIMLRKKVKEQEKEIKHIEKENTFLEEESAFFAASRLKFIAIKTADGRINEEGKFRRRV